MFEKLEVIKEKHQIYENKKIKDLFSAVLSSSILWTQHLYTIPITINNNIHKEFNFVDILIKLRILRDV